MFTWTELVFLLFAVNKNFDPIEKNDSGIPSQDNLRPGDLLMRETNIGLYHAGVYDGKRVIEFTAPHNLTWGDYFTSFSSTIESGTVNIKSLKTFIANNPYCVLRPKKPIPENFSDLVEEALDYNGTYHPLTNNCLHFAFNLLGLNPAPIPESLPQEEGLPIIHGDL